MQHPGTDIVFPSPRSGREAQTAFVHASLMIGTIVSHNSRIPASKGNPISSVQASGNGNTLSTLAG